MCRAGVFLAVAAVAEVEAVELPLNLEAHGAAQAGAAVVIHRVRPMALRVACAQS